MVPCPFEDTRFFSDTKRAMRLHILKTLKTVTIAALLYPCFTLFLYIFFSFISMLWAYWVMTAILFALLIYREIRPALKKKVNLLGRFMEISSEELFTMDEKYSAMTPIFNTLFLFDKYIYFPDDMLLIPYTELNDIKEEFSEISLLSIFYVFHFFRFKTGAALKIICTDGSKYRVKIRKFDEYRDYRLSFFSSLYEQIEKAGSTAAISA